MLASLCSLLGEVQVQSDTLLGVGEGAGTEPEG